MSAGRRTTPRRIGPGPLLSALAAVVAHLAAGCRTPDPGKAALQPPAQVEPAPAPASETRAVFREVAEEAGIRFVHNSGAFGRKWLPETMGSGCAWVDYDGDGDVDALLLSGKDFPGHPTGGRQALGLFRNEGGRFTEVTRSVGLADPVYAMGATCADYDADGDQDIYVTALGPNRLYRNDGGRFTETARSLGVDDPGFGSSAAWFDYDRDGDVDLLTLNYVQWSPETDIFCALDGTNKSYCTPEAYTGASPRLYRNDGERFVDVTAAAGMADATAKALGVLCVDYDADGWEDVFMANDTQPNFLFRNRGDGTFVEEGVMAGVAFDETGRARGAMGVDAADYDHSGRPSLVVGNFANEMLGLYRNEGNGLFIDVAPASAVGRQSLLTLAFGTFFLDFDLDGYADIFVGNGHVESEIRTIQREVAYEQPPHLFRNLGGGRFEDVAPNSGALVTPMVARGAAAGDYDGDGDLDILVNTSGGPAKLFRNDGAVGSRALRIRLVGGAGSNVDGYGARVEVLAGGLKQTGWCRSGNSYCSQSEATLTFGLGTQSLADEVVVTWPSGKVSRVTGVSAGATLTLRESEAAPSS